MTAEVFTVYIEYRMKYSKTCLKRPLKRRPKLEDLKVLRRSPDLLNNVKIGQLQLIMEQSLFYHIFWPSDLNNLNKNPSNNPVISARKMFR